MKTLAIIITAITVAFASPGQTNTSAQLYIHFGFESFDSTKRLLSARIHLGEAIFVGGDDYWKLTGHVERHGTNLMADLIGNTGSQIQFYKGEVRLEKPFFAQGGGASGGVVPLWFAVSTNSDCSPILENLEKTKQQRSEGKK
jgi:hypothetical protein